jgi:hypothetical protein
MKIGLKTDFCDYYDHCFTAPVEEADKVLERVTTVTMPRSTMLLYLESIGMSTPAHGPVADLVPVVTERSGMPEDIALRLFDLVVYVDETVRSVEGIQRMSCKEALARYPDAYAHVYIPSHLEGNSMSLRYLRIGMRQFWLRYTSRNDWRANYGDFQVELLHEEQRARERHVIPYPLFAIDYVLADRLYAVDLNVAPLLQGTGVEQRMFPHEVHDELCGWMRGDRFTMDL